MPHLLAAALTTTGDHRLRSMACDACWYLLARGDTRTAHGLASSLREHCAIGSATTIGTP
jgi:hypothetical protein